MDLVGNLDVIAAAVEQLSAITAVSAAYDGSTSIAASSSPTRPPKLVLPPLTAAMQHDFVLSKGTGAKTTKPLSISLRPEFADYPLQGIVTPHPNDVLCGRGGGSNNHPGNESFRVLVNEVKVSYVNCPKREKPLIARQIVEAVRNQTPPGRFLSKDSNGEWNDIGDGRAREKTSQALREGAPVIRVMAARPPSPKDVAAAVKEAKKAERSDKDCVVTCPETERKKQLLANPTAEDAQMNNESSSINEDSVSSGSPSKAVVSNSGPMNLLGGSFGKTLWPPAPQLGRRAFNTMPYTHNNTGQMMGGFSAPPHSFTDYPFGVLRYPEYVPTGTVRMLLLGQLDPVQLACQLLPPEEAAIVARRYSEPTSKSHPVVPLNGKIKPSTVSSSSAICPLILNPQVSDASSSTEGSMHRTQSDVSSVDSPKPSRSSAKHSLPKKKRKYIESMDM